MDQPDQWLLKGGFALQLRIGVRARTTKDIDLLSYSPIENMDSLLSMALNINLQDWFAFEIPDWSSPLPEGSRGARFPVLSLLDGRKFEEFHVDIGIGDRVIAPPDLLKTPPLLAFAEIPSTSVPCYPLTQHLAEKLHALTRIYEDRDNSRVKDLIDILLISLEKNINVDLLKQSIQVTFTVRNTHLLPESLPEPLHSWGSPYKKLALEVGLSEIDLKSGFDKVSRFLNPILSGQCSGEWDPVEQIWK